MVAGTEEAICYGRGRGHTRSTRTDHGRGADARPPRDQTALPDGRRSCSRRSRSQNVSLYTPSSLDEAMSRRGRDQAYGDKLREALDTTGKDKRSRAMPRLTISRSEVVESVSRRRTRTRRQIGRPKVVLATLRKRYFARTCWGIKPSAGWPPKFSEIRPISCEVGWLPRVHGSALVHSRRDAGDGHHDARHQGGRAISWTTYRERYEVESPVHAAL